MRLTMSSTPNIPSNSLAADWPYSGGTVIHILSTMLLCLFLHIVVVSTAMLAVRASFNTLSPAAAADRLHNRAAEGPTGPAAVALAPYFVLDPASFNDILGEDYVWCVRVYSSVSLGTCCV